MTDITIALDAMGGDYGSPVIVPAALEILQQEASLWLVLVGDADDLNAQLAKNNATISERLRIHHASEKVAMNELPSQALRNKKDSSMRVALNLVKEGTADACVSAGNTGALMATARYVLKTLPSIDRPAILAALPTMKPGVIVRVLDLGANVDTTAEHLLQFAVMGSVVASAVDNIEKPTVALLNIGSEEIKGNEQIKKTAQLLFDNPSIHYIGYVEGDAVYQGVADVIVCDGFVGNVMLKTTEGVAKMFLLIMKEAFQANIFTKVIGLFAKQSLKKALKRMNPSSYGGATLIGLQKPVIKCHGGADKTAVMIAIKQAMREVEKEVPQRIRDQVAQMLNKGEAA